MAVQFEEMYEQKRKEVNKAAEKFEKQLKAAKRSGSKANQDKVQSSSHRTMLSYTMLFILCQTLLETRLG